MRVRERTCAHTRSMARLCYRSLLCIVGAPHIFESRTGQILTRAATLERSDSDCKTEQSDNPRASQSSSLFHVVFAGDMGQVGLVSATTSSEDQRTCSRPRYPILSVDLHIQVNITAQRWSRKAHSCHASYTIKRLGMRVPVRRD